MFGIVIQADPPFCPRGRGFYRVLGYYRQLGRGLDGSPRWAPTSGIAVELKRGRSHA